MIAALMALATVIQGVARLQAKADPITDVTQTLAAVANGENHLALVCDPPKTVTVNIAGNDYLGNQQAGILAGGADVIYRFDKGEPHTSRAALNGKTLILAPGENIPFMLWMRGASMLHLRVTRYDGNPSDFAINLAGFDPLMDQVLAACGFAPTGKRLKKH